MAELYPMAEASICTGAAIASKYQLCAFFARRLAPKPIGKILVWKSGR
jgi:hypothetical protein